MVTVANGTPLLGLTCRICHRPVHVGETVLVSFHGGEPRVIHAHLCRLPAPADNLTRTETDGLIRS